MNLSLVSSQSRIIPRSVLAGDGDLLHLLGDLKEGLVSLVGGLGGTNNLDELHGWDGVEKVQTAKVGLALFGARGGDLSDGERGGVGGKDCRGAGGQLRANE